MKKTLLIVAALCLFSWASFAQTVATEPSGNGTEGTPYQIETLANLLWITENPEHWDKYYLQTADIDATETASWNEGEGWVPIGVDANNDFTGTYNGGDYTISNLTINRPTANYQGLFGSAENATIKNIRLVNVNIVGAARTGAVVGQTYYSNTDNCLSTGTIIGTTYVGGLVGFNNYSNITQCFSNVNVTGTNYIGGITGVHQGDNLLLNSYSTGNLAGGNYVGGLVGTTSASSQIKKSFYAGEINGDNGLGGIVANRLSASDALNCFWDTEASGVSTTEVGGEGKTTAQMKDIYTYTSTGWDFKGLGEVGIWNIDPDGYPYLSWINPTNDGPDAPVVANIIANEVTNITGAEATINATVTCVGYPTATQHGVCWNTTGSPTIANDKTTEGVVAQAGSFSSTASGLTQNTTYYVRAYATNGEGTSYSNEFTFVTVIEPTGNGTPETPYQISNLAELYWIAITPSVWDKHFIQTADIDATQTLGWNNGEGWIPIGNEEELFAGDYNGNNHLITNLHIYRPNSNYIGLFGGVSAAKIYDLGLLDVNIVGGSYTGGFSGWLQNAQLERCFVTGSVEGKGGRTGGLMGVATEGTIIKNSYSNANLTGYTGSYGYGGLAGGIDGSNVSNCFMSGIVSLPMGGGLIGYATESEVIGSFWDTESSGIIGGVFGTGKTTAEMNDISTFLNGGWDFKGLGAKGIWNIGNGRNNGYPYLSWQFPDDPAISIEILPSAVITDVTSITQTSATFNIDVTNIGNPQGTQFGVCWSSTNPEPTTSDDNELSTEPFALGSYTIGVGALNHSTTYYARAFATNTNGTAYGEVVTFNTECGAHTLPLTENFDNIEFGEIPLCWNRIVEGNGHSQVVEWGYGYSQPKNVSLFAQTIGATIYLVSPEIDAEISSVAIEFMARNVWGTDMILELGTMSNPFDANTFEYYSNVTVPVDYQQFSVSYENYLGDNRYIAFRVSSNIQEQRGYVFIDDVTIDVAPSCPAPYSLRTNAVTQTTAEASWTEPATSTQWDIIYGPAGFDVNTEGTILTSVTSNPFILTDLNHSTNYEFYVRTYCNETPSGWSAAGSFTTECGPIELSFINPLENQTYDFSISNQIPYTIDYKGCEEIIPSVRIVDESENYVRWINGLYFNSSTIGNYMYDAPIAMPSGTYRLRMDYWDNEQMNYVYSNYFYIENNNAGIEIWEPFSYSYWVKEDGKQYSIVWMSNNVASVNLSYSIDNGNIWNTIENGVSSLNGMNNYLFEIPSSIDGHFTECIIKIEDASNINNIDYSDVFTITSIPPVSFIEPTDESIIEIPGNINIVFDNFSSSWIEFYIEDNYSNNTLITGNNYEAGQASFYYSTNGLIIGETYRIKAHHYNTDYWSHSEYFTVSKATPTITEWPTASGIIYGDALSASVLTGGYAEHNSTQVEGTFTFDSPAYEPGAGPYMANVTFTPTNNETYSTVSGTVEVTVAKADPVISVWPVASAITYGAAISQSTISGGTVNVAGTFSFDSPATKPNAGTYAADVTFTPTDNANYNTVMGSVDITVNTAPLTIIANSFSKQAGTDYVFAGDEFTTNPAELVGSDAVNSVTLTSDGAINTATMGDYTITPSEASGIGLNNYTITYQNGVLTVTDKTILTISGLAVNSKEYDGTTDATISDWGTLIGVETGHDVSLNTATATVLFGNKNAGNGKTVTLSNLELTGTDAGSYVINDQYASADIYSKALVVEANSESKTYGQDDPEFTALFNGFISGENESVLEGTLAITREPGEDVDTYTITPAGLSSNNYNITFQTGLLTINAKELIITANDAEKIYGSNDPALNVSYTGFEFTDNETVLLGELAVSRETGEDVNTYLITPSGLSASNYSLSYVNGTFTITPKTLTITAENKTKVYGSDDPAFSIEYSGFAAADDLSSLSGTLEFSRDAGENVGTYAIVPSGYSSTNYTIGYTPGALLITPKLLTISANNASKVYGTSDPAFTVSYTGFIAGEDKTVLNGTLGTNRESGETVANYVITPSGLSSTNYTISYATGLLSITAKELTVGGSFATSNREYDGTNAATISANSLTLQGVITSDEVTLNPAVAFDNKNTGTSKVVSLTNTTTLTGTDAVNYTLSLTGAPTATANITAKELTVTGAIAASKVYDGTTNAIISGATLSGVIGSDVVTMGNATTGTFAQKFVGADVAVTTAITISGTDAGNYIVIQPSGLQANITTKELTIEGSFTVHDKEYDGNTTATINENNLTLAGSISGDEISLTGIMIAFANADIGNDKTVSITAASLDGADKNNYTLSLEGSPTTTASITVSPSTTFTVTYSVVGGNGSLAATVDGSPINSGDEILATKAVEFTATPLEGYRVKRWTNNGTTVAGNTTNSYTVSGIQQNTSVTVEFEEIPPVVYTLTLVVSPANAGTVTGEGEYEAAEQVTITASPAEGFVFTGWTGNVAEPMDATTTFTMPAEDATITANFEPEQPETFTVTFTVKSNTQEPIEDAEISVDSEVITTNSNGEASTSLANGSYSYSVTTSGYEEHSGNFSISGENKSIAITMVTVGNNVELLSDVEIYPNPFDQKIVIEGIEGVQRIAITNVAGQLIKNIKISNETEITIGAGNISAGTYIVTLYFTNGDIQNRKIVKVN